MKDLEKAGKIASEALKFGEKLIKVDGSLLDVVNKVEDKIISLGGGLAFPTQISINEIAAHYNPSVNDELKFKKEDIAKLDIGVHVNGYIADTALSIDLGGNEDLKKASAEALKEAIKEVQIGTELGKIGKIIEDTIRSFDFNPIKNLSGHELKQYDLHAGLTIPNYDNKDNTTLEKGMMIAIEPFATSGVGIIKEGKGAEVYKLMEIKGVRNPTTKKVLKFIENTYKTLPFSKRVLIKKFGNVSFPLRILENERMILEYTQLVEKSGAKVSQAEHTVLIDDKIKVITER